MIGTMAEREGIKDVHLYIPTELFERIQAEAKAQRRRVNAQILVALEEWLARKDSRPA
jgi:hypothetical protein